ncbi:MAG: SEC-C domain-containing protein [Candidatus Hydrogenedentes bacterium]|nr:SEC-C domain-containing protein [Candidatus Hydrogenedentota bacterium]
MALGVSNWLKPSMDFADYTPEACVGLVASDLPINPGYDALLVRLKQCPREDIVRLVTAKLEQTMDTFGSSHLARLMGDLGCEEFLSLLTDCLEDQRHDSLIESAAKALERFGGRAESAILDRWKNFDSCQKMFAMEILAKVGGEATIQHLADSRQELRHDRLEFWCIAAEALPDERLLEVLGPELKREHPEIDNTFYLMATLLEADHPQLPAVRRRLEAYNRGIEESIENLWKRVPSRYLRLSLECSTCGDTNLYDVYRICLDPSDGRSQAFIGDELSCKSCNASDCLEITSSADMAVTTEALRIVAASAAGKPVQSPVRLVKIALMNGRRVSVADAIKQYSSAVSRNPNSAIDWLCLSNCYSNVGRKRKAEHGYRECLRIDPSCAEAAMSLATILEDTGNDSEALSVLHKTMQLKNQWRFYRLVDTTPKEFTESYIAYYNELSPFPYEPQPGHGESGEALPFRKSTSPNAACPCGSGKKYKKCCGRVA